MSSLKDWYRYVDSKARSRAEGAAPTEHSAEERSDRPTPAEAGTEGSKSAVGSQPGAAEGEEGLDIWSGLFPQRRKPEPKPTTAPLKLPSVNLSEVPPDLPFARMPIDSPPAPQFPLPEAEVSIPSFEEFVSPFAPEPSPPARVRGPEGAAAPGPAPGAPAPPARAATTEPVATAVLSGAPPTGRAPAAETGVTAAPPAGTGSPPSPAPTEEPAPGAVAPAAPSEAVAAGTTQASPPGEPAAASVSGAPVPPEGASPPEVPGVDPLAPDTERPATEAGQLRWRSPFQLPGPGRTVSSGAPSPRPEPILPRANPAGAARASQDTSAPKPGDDAGSLHRTPRPSPSRVPEDPGSDAAPVHPAPGTEAWERERVERLARTFRETLRALEESMAVPAPPVAPEPAPPIEAAPAPAAPMPASAPLTAVEWETPAIAAEPPRAQAPAPEPEPASSLLGERLDETNDDAGDLASAVPVAEEPIGAAALPAASEPAAIAAPAEPEMAPLAGEAASLAVVAAPPPAAPAAVAAAPATVEAASALDSVSAAPSPRAPAALSPSTPDVLRNIQEAALIRQRLPQHMAMLLRIPTNEVAQNSYKSPFRETREALIGRLLDPQLTLEEAARMLGVCPTTVRRYTNRGMLHCHRTPGNQRRFRMSDVLQFLEQYGDRIDRAAEARQLEEAA